MVRQRPVGYGSRCQPSFPCVAVTAFSPRRKCFIWLAPRMSSAQRSRWTTNVEGILKHNTQLIRSSLCEGPTTSDCKAMLTETAAAMDFGHPIVQKSRLLSIQVPVRAMRSHHSHSRSPLEAALWEFRDRERQWLAEKAALRKEAEAERRHTRALQHRLEGLQADHQYTLRELSSVKATLQKRDNDLQDLESLVQDQESAACQREELQCVLNASLSRLEAAIGAAQSQEARVASLVEQIEQLREERDGALETSGTVHTVFTPQQSMHHNHTGRNASAGMCRTAGRSDLRFDIVTPPH